ncbi:MAG: dihydrofolate reductase family protein [Actinomycetota bacterium]
MGVTRTTWRVPSRATCQEGSPPRSDWPTGPAWPGRAAWIGPPPAASVPLRPHRAPPGVLQKPLSGRRRRPSPRGRWVAWPLNTLPKYVASTTLTEPLEWQNSRVLQGGVAEAVAALKQEDGDDLHVIGSTKLVQTLIEHDLVDQFRVMIDPVVVGGGKRIFRDDGAPRPLRLIDSQVTTTGAILATYAPAGG